MGDLGTDTTSRVSQALEADERTREAAIEIVVEQGVVTLKGLVQNADVKQAAEEIARAQPGVVSVVDALEVRSVEKKEDPRDDVVQPISTLVDYHWAERPD